MKNKIGNGVTTLLLDKQEFEEDKKEEKLKLELKELKLKLKEEKKVTWDEKVIDNEHMNKKKSKICCIYHRPRLNPDDPSSDESCSSCDEKGKNAYERPNHYEKQKNKENNNHHGKCGCCKN
jgi:hypothetical protein